SVLRPTERRPSSASCLTTHPRTRGREIYAVSRRHFRANVANLAPKLCRSQHFYCVAPAEDPRGDLDRSSDSDRHVHGALGSVAERLRWMPDRFLNARGRGRIEAQADFDWLA